MTWVLVIFLQCCSYASGAVTVDYSTKEQCIASAQILLKRRSVYDAFCIVRD